MNRKDKLFVGRACTIFFLSYLGIGSNFIDVLSFLDEENNCWNYMLRYNLTFELETFEIESSHMG